MGRGRGEAQRSPWLTSFSMELPPYTSVQWLLGPTVLNYATQDKPSVLEAGINRRKKPKSFSCIYPGPKHSNRYLRGNMKNDDGNSLGNQSSIQEMGLVEAHCFWMYPCRDSFHHSELAGGREYLDLVSNTTYLDF